MTDLFIIKQTDKTNETVLVQCIILARLYQPLHAQTHIHCFNGLS